MTVTGVDTEALFGGEHHRISNVLLRAPALSSFEDEACVDLLTIADVDRENVLSVTFTQTAADRLEIWRTHVGDELPARAGIISVGERTRSTDEPAPSSGADTVRVETVANPANLTDLGVKISRHLSEWSENDDRTVVCFHSLTTLLQYAALGRVLGFLHVLAGRISAIDAVAHDHINRGAHDRRTYRAILQVIDAVVELGPDGACDVRRQ